MDSFIGTIMAVGFNFAPRGWELCNGQLLSIAQNSALFSLLGTVYGGDGHSTFALPDLRGRVAVGSQAQGPGLENIEQGQMGGANNVTAIGTGNVNVTLTAANLPAHTHPATMTMSSLSATTTVTVGTGTTGVTSAQAQNGGLTSTAPGASSAAVYLPANTAPAAPVNLGGVSTSVSGSGTVTVDANTGGGASLAAPVSTTATTSVMQPFTGLTYIICVEGIFPSRS